MSVVAVKITDKKIEISADSFVGSHYSQHKIDDVKIFQQDDLIFGGVGYASEISLFKVFCKTHKPKEATVEDIIDFIVEFDDWMKKRLYKEMFNSWIIVFKKKVFYADCDLYVREVFDYDAIGAGEAFARAALYYSKSSSEAVRVACELSPVCEEPITTIRMAR